jgi:hypothetical protein
MMMKWQEVMSVVFSLTAVHPLLSGVKTTNNGVVIATYHPALP